jgi:predicted HTH domain antitoxin
LLTIIDVCILENATYLWQAWIMTLELPDAGLEGFAPEELQLELACALYARGLVGKVRGAQIAGVDFFAFQRALGERGIPTYTIEMLHQDLDALRKIFPE